AGSAGHRLQRASHRGGGALRIAASDRAMLGETSDALDQMPSARGDGVAASDVTAWLTVALVRAGVRVRPVPLPAGMVWHRVRDAADVAEAAAHLQSTDAEAVRLTGAVKAQDGFFTTFFVSPYSRFIARWAARRGWSPDQVTAVSMATGVAAAAAFAVGSRPAMVAGALLLQVAFMLDCVDGQLARYARLVTPLGAWLDSVFDRGKEYVAYAGLAIGGIRAGDDASLWVLAAAALALQTVRHTIDFGYGVHQDRALANAQHAPFTDGEEPEPGFWDRAATDPVGASPVRAGGIAARIVTALRHAERIAPVKWAKRIVPLPIGERFALISIVAAVASPRAVFVALLAWGGTAAAYTFGGRFVRSWT
ncbi:MAG: CDP-alcohol phosphatidyltransferase family protein, partial [Nitriliruptoraceae bacterium]